MKNRKGFTLIEIITALIILGILFIIAVPAVSRSIMGSRDSGYITTIKKFIEAARNEVTAHEYVLTNTDTTYYIPTMCLNVENKEETPYGKMAQSYVVIVTEADGSHNYYYYGRDETNHGMNLTASDDIATDKLKDDIKTVTPNKKIGNREKIVVYSNDCDKSISSTNYGNTEEATCGQVSGASTTWTSNNRTITVRCEGSCKQTTYRKTFDKTTKIGIIEIESRNGTKVKCRVNVYVDKGDQAAKIVATKKITNREVEDGQVSSEGLHFTINRTSNGPSGGSIYYCKDTEDECNPNTTIQEGRKITRYEDVEGVYYVRYKVVGGNGTESDIYSYEARVDTKRPTVTAVGKKKTAGTSVATDTWSDEGLNYSFTITKNGIADTKVYYCSDTNNTCEPTSRFNGTGNLETYNSKTGTYYVRYKAVKEETNRESEISSYKAKVDTEAPNCSLTLNPTGCALSATLTVTATETGGSGLATEAYSWISATSGYGTATVKSINSNGTHSAWVRDAAGNVGTCSKAVSNIDTTAPTVSLIAHKRSDGGMVATDTWSNEGLNFTLTSPRIGTCSTTIKYCKDTANTCTPNTTITSGSLITDYSEIMGTYYIRYVVTSESGLSSSIESYKAKVDKIVPTVNITARKKTSGTGVSSGTTSNEGLNFILTAETVGPSGETIMYCKDTTNTCTPTTLATSGALITDYNTTEGNYYIRYKITSGAGKSSGVLSYNAVVTSNVAVTVVWKIGVYKQYNSSSPLEKTYSNINNLANVTPVVSTENGSNVTCTVDPSAKTVTCRANSIGTVTATSNSACKTLIHDKLGITAASIEANNDEVTESNRYRYINVNACNVSGSNSRNHSCCDSTTGRPQTDSTSDFYASNPSNGYGCYYYRGAQMNWTQIDSTMCLNYSDYKFNTVILKGDNNHCGPKCSSSDPTGCFTYGYFKSSNVQHNPLCWSRVRYWDVVTITYYKTN